MSVNMMAASLRCSMSALTTWKIAVARKQSRPRKRCDASARQRSWANSWPGRVGKHSAKDFSTKDPAPRTLSVRTSFQRDYGVVGDSLSFGSHGQNRLRTLELDCAPEKSSFGACAWHKAVYVLFPN